MESAQRTYVPGAGRHWLLPLYDPLVKLLGGDRARRKLLDQVVIQGSQRILDIGCGTGSLVVLIKRLHPDAEVVGLDPDPKALVRGGRKARQAAVSARFDEGFSDQLPYPDSSFHQVFSSFMFHHLERTAKEKTLREVARVLRPGGRLHLLDFEGPEPNGAGRLSRLLHSSHYLEDNSENQILQLMRQAGFVDPKKAGDGRMFLWRTALYQASVPVHPGTINRG